MFTVSGRVPDQNSRAGGGMRMPGLAILDEVREEEQPALLRSRDRLDDRDDRLSEVPERRSLAICIGHLRLDGGRWWWWWWDRFSN